MSIVKCWQGYGAMGTFGYYLENSLTLSIKIEYIPSYDAAIPKASRSKYTHKPSYITQHEY